MYIYEQTDWPKFKWDSNKLLTLLTKVRNLQGGVVGKMGALGFELKKEANFEILIEDVLKSSEIEDKLLNKNQVRSSIARRLGLEISGLIRSDRDVDGVVEMMLDAIMNFNEPLTAGRLFGWNNSLFPSGYSGLFKILIGKWRKDSKGPMQVVSGAMGKEKVHFQAPESGIVKDEMKTFLKWINKKQDIDLVIKAGLAHLWFVTIHPFEDGNGRIARAITDMILAQSDKQVYRFYSMSSQIRKERTQYYKILEKTQKGNLDVTDWLEWFLNCLYNALENSEIILEKVIRKHQFWSKNNSKIDNERQRKLLNKLLDGFDGKLTTSKWAKIGNCSQDTALRDIQKLINMGILYKLSSGGRSTGYNLINE